MARVVRGLPARRRALLAVDGIGASGKSTFAAALAGHVRTRPVVLLHADDFFHPAAVRHARGRFSPEGFWLDTYDYDALVSWALGPLCRGGTGLYRRASFDRDTGAATCPDVEQAPEDALVVVEGTFLHRDELATFWDASVYLDVPTDVAERRMRQRGGLDEQLADALLARYAGAQRLYLAHARPWERASVVVDNTDPTAPAVIAPARAHAAR
ncbi:uridine kinase [Cellulomonas shaoxiangyii]|uniref:Uridine kinase n=1 Tax=Cellulomonas shaoxiangyii TaxID=2566013 RepID=A0A4P7SMI7_9CELL|nr:uridine kinase [Cellulomonas shaoxiangyii]TGY86584.1 uridine kinase [Cellulomonas shaoxiangyii]